MLSVLLTPENGNKPARAAVIFDASAVFDFDDRWSRLQLADDLIHELTTVAGTVRQIRQQTISELVANPKTTYVEIGRRLGVTGERVAQLLGLRRKNRSAATAVTP